MNGSLLLGRERIVRERSLLLGRERVVAARP
jgi:hypothetical protein